MAAEATTTPPSGRTWAIVGVLVGLVVLAVFFFLRATIFAPGNAVGSDVPTQVAQATLDDLGNRGTGISLVLRDANGQDSALTGQLRVDLREPDGAVWTFNQNVSPSDFHPIPSGSLLSGRLGFHVVVPPDAWARPPRHGGQASLNVQVTPRNGEAFTYNANEPFP